MLGYIMYTFFVTPIGFAGVFWICFGAEVLGFILGYFLPEDHEWKK